MLGFGKTGPMSDVLLGREEVLLKFTDAAKVQGGARDTEWPKSKQVMFRESPPASGNL